MFNVGGFNSYLNKSVDISGLNLDKNNNKINSRKLNSIEDKTDEIARSSFVELGKRQPIKNTVFDNSPSTPTKRSIKKFDNDSLPMTPTKCKVSQLVNITPKKRYKHHGYKIDFSQLDPVEKRLLMRSRPTIYSAKNIKDPSKNYVGLTTQAPAKRWEQHLNKAKNGSNTLFHRVLGSPDGADIEFGILFQGGKAKNLGRWEKLFIRAKKSHYKRGGLNSVDGGGLGKPSKTKRLKNNIIKKLRD